MPARAGIQAFPPHPVHPVMPAHAGIHVFSAPPALTAGSRPQPSFANSASDKDALE